MRKLYSFLSLIIMISVFSGISNAQNKMSLGVQAGIAVPMGDFGDAVDLGFGGQGNFVYSVAPNIDITGSLGYLTWSYKLESDVTSGSFSSVPLLAGIRYTFPAKGFAPYVMAQLGLHFVSSSIEINYDPYYYMAKGDGTSIVTSTQATYKVSDSSTKFGFGLGAGFLLPLSPKLDLDVNATFNNISTDGSSSNYIGIMAGVLMAL